MLVSVIVPVYKAERWLHRCVDSILAQTMDDFELLLIDDGSPDRSGEICDEYVAKDSRVRVFHKENGGVSSARNMGLDNAQGEWISFVDADDWVEVEYLAGLTENLDADMILGGCKYTTGEICATYDNYFIKETIGECIVKYGINSILRTPWGNLLKKSIINQYNLLFDISIRYGEDTLFNKQYLFYCDSIRVIYKLNYNYNFDENFSGGCMDKYQLTLEEIGNVCMKIYNINNDLEKKFGIIVNEFEIKNNFLSMYKVDSFSNSGEVLFFYDLYRKYYLDVSLSIFCNDAMFSPLIIFLVQIKEFYKLLHYEKAKAVFEKLVCVSEGLPWNIKFKYKDFYLWYFLIKCGWWRIFDFLMKLYCRFK